MELENFDQAMKDKIFQIGQTGISGLFLGHMPGFICVSLLYQVVFIRF